MLAILVLGVHLLVHPVYRYTGTPSVPMDTPVKLSISVICVYLCVICVFLFHTAYVLYYCEHGGMDLMGLKPNP